MMPYKPFGLIKPTTLKDLKEALFSMDETTRVLAGGTDLMPNVKNGLVKIHRFISLRNIAELRKIAINNDHISLGATTTLSEIAQHAEIKKQIPALAFAAQQIGSPQIRNMGTIGGNICLDTRCLYINQSEFWRKSLGYCLKKDGTCCHVVPTGKRCVAAASNDLATVLLAASATIEIISGNHLETSSLRDFYTADGIKNNILTNNQVVSSINVPTSNQNHIGFFKLRHRESIDFPLLSVAVCFQVNDHGSFMGGSLVINALVAKPKIMDLGNFTATAMG